MVRALDSLDPQIHPRKERPAYLHQAAKRPVDKLVVGVLGIRGAMLPSS